LLRDPKNNFWNNLAEKIENEENFAQNLLSSVDNLRVKKG
jgi:hypothetical protein